MRKKIFITAIFVILAGIFNGLMDSIQFHYSSSIPARQEWNAQYWNPLISWENKYKTNSEGILIQPLQAKFIGSKTVFVWTTDAWHLLKMLYNTFLKMAIVLLFVDVYLLLSDKKFKKLGYAVAYAIVFFSLYIIQATGFHLIYTFLS